MYTGGPFVLEMNSVDASWKHSIGWMERSERRGGPCYVVVKATFTGSLRVIERFPLTDAGWSRAWKALVRLDRDGAAGDGAAVLQAARLPRTGVRASQVSTTLHAYNRSALSARQVTPHTWRWPGAFTRR